MGGRKGAGSAPRAERSIITLGDRRSILEYIAMFRGNRSRVVFSYDREVSRRVHPNAGAVAVTSLSLHT